MNVGRAIEGKLHKPKRQLAMVFDLNKCLGCHTCAVACKTQWTNDIFPDLTKDPAKL